jgi:hypothetical protein
MVEFASVIGSDAQYMAPERLKLGKPSNAAGVWSFGGLYPRISVDEVIVCRRVGVGVCDLRDCYGRSAVHAPEALGSHRDQRASRRRATVSTSV